MGEPHKNLGYKKILKKCLGDCVYRKYHFYLHTPIPSVFSYLFIEYNYKNVLVREN